jgi:hypothetical protein
MKARKSHTLHQSLIAASLAALFPAHQALAAISLPIEVEERVIIQSDGSAPQTQITVEVNGQTFTGEEAKRHLSEARKHMQLAQAQVEKSRVQVRDLDIQIPDMTGLANSISSSFAYSFTSDGMKPVKNAPYSGEIINERVQMLPDGNQIVKRNTQRVFRDSQGATRQEVLDDSGQPRVVNIRDMEGNRFVVTPAKKSALKIGSPKVIAEKLAADGSRTAEKRIIINSGKGEPVVSSSENIVVKRVDSSGKEKVEEIRVRAGPASVSVVGSGGLAGLSELGKLSELSQLSELSVLGDASFAAGDAFAMAWRHGEPSIVRSDKSYERTTTQLGSKNFDGVIAEGKMVSYTIPAGKVGNARPITVSTETWYSPDLKITVYSKHSDPRSGDVIYRVANLKRGEQSTELFRVPADYELKDPLAKLAKSIKIERVEKTDKK